MVLTEWSMDPFLFVAAVWVTGFYLSGVWLLRRRGDHWPIGRTLAGTASSGPRRSCWRWCTPGWVKVLSVPPLAFALYIISSWALYFSGWYDVSLASAHVHQMMHVHLVLVRSPLFWPLLGVDPLPGRASHPLRLLLVLALPHHAFLGITIMSQESIIAGDHYAQLRAGPMAAWLPSMADDQHLAGAILWVSGDLVGLTFFATLFVQWVRSSMKEAEREDRRLDRLEARATSGPAER